MALGILVLITALTISAVAIYYSVAGLVAIFAAAALPIIIMGGALEIGKLVTAVWLHKYWKQATWWLKTYLTLAVVVLMFITSMGIFGFLSKAHIEQTSAAGEGVAQIEQIEKSIASQQAIITRAEQIIETTQTTGTGADQNIQAQIDREQERIDTAYDRVQPAIEATRAQLESDKQFYLDQLPAIDGKLAQFETLSRIDTSNEEAVKQLQALVGARPDGDYGSGTARAVKAYKESLEQERTDLLAKVEELKVNAQEEIARLRSRAETEIDDSNKLITRLRSQLGTSTGEDIDAIIDEQNARIKAANLELDTLTEEKFVLESEYRKLEAEVGPIKYIAEFVYGDTADNNMLEEAVRWVILIIIFVFDPLAVLLLIASQYTFEFNRKRKDDNGERLRQWNEYEQARAQRIVDNPGYNNDDTKEKKDESRQEDPKEEQQNAEELRDRQEQEGIQAETGDDPVVAEAESQEGPVEDVATEKEGSGDNTESSDGDRLTPGTYTGDPQPVPVEQEDDTEQVEETVVEKKELESSDELDQEDDITDVEKWNAWVNAANEAAASSTIEARAEELTTQEDDPNWTEAKRKWKEENPNQNLKDWKHAYITGRIEELPWAKYITEDYVQNAEQNENSVWQRIQNKDNK